MTVFLFQIKYSVLTRKNRMMAVT